MSKHTRAEYAERGEIAAPSPSAEAVAQAYREANSTQVFRYVSDAYTWIDQRAVEIDASAPAAALGGDDLLARLTSNAIAADANKMPHMAKCLRDARSALTTPTAQPSAKDGEGDWTEDFTHENGNYNNTCHQCQRVFVGHKRRITCKLCSAKDGVSDSDVRDLIDWLGGMAGHPAWRGVCMDSHMPAMFKNAAAIVTELAVPQTEATTAASLVDGVPTIRFDGDAVEAVVQHLLTAGYTCDGDYEDFFMGVKNGMEAAIGREVGDSDDVERCESGDPECGPVEFHDVEGVPLCRVCWEGLLADSANHPGEQP